LVCIRAAAPSEVLEIGHKELLRIVQTDSNLSDVLMRAFLLRRFNLVSRQLGDLFLVGSNHSPDMLRIREFLTRNDRPYSTIDIDRDSQAQAVLDRFGVSVDETPILVQNDGAVHASIRGKNRSSASMWRRAFARRSAALQGCATFRIPSAAVRLRP